MSSDRVSDAQAPDMPENPDEHAVQHRWLMAPGMNEWLYVQDIVLVTFKAFHDVLKAQGDTFRSQERTLNKKASPREVAAALATKVSADELADKLHCVDAQLARKADTAMRATAAHVHLSSGFALS